MDIAWNWLFYTVCVAGVVGYATFKVGYSRGFRHGSYTFIGSSSGPERVYYSNPDNDY